MHRILITAAMATFVLAISPALSQAAKIGDPKAQSGRSANPINGTWKADLNSVQFDPKPDEFVLQQGTYSCNSCGPAYSVIADGAFHPVSLPYADSDSVKVVDDHTIIETAKKNGRDVGTSTMSISADGNTLTGVFTDSTAPGTPVKGEFTETRVGPAPAGAHAISGKWKILKLSNFNDAGLNVTMNVEGDTYRSSSLNGTSFEAKLGGADVPIKGDIAGTMVSVTKVGNNSYLETHKRDGKVVSLITLTLGPDGKLHGVDEEKLSGTTTRWTSDKQ